MKNKLLKDLYDCFYTPPELPAQKQEIEACHQALIEALDKPERRLVLQIIDAKDRIVEDTSIDSFISGFELAWKLSMQKQACGIVGGFMEDIFGKELKPWQENEKPETEP